jgi:hypothetical protein
VIGAGWQSHDIACLDSARDEPTLDVVTDRHVQREGQLAARNRYVADRTPEFKSPGVRVSRSMVAPFPMVTRLVELANP